MIRRNLSLFILTICACLAFSFVAVKVSSSSNDMIDFADGVVLDANNNKNDTSLKNSIQVALILDTSSSMNGLIEQAKSQLWNILNELAKTEKDGQETDLQIALYEYGNPVKANSEYQIHQLSDFTNDMDKISEDLFSLTTNGGEEYCGAVLKRSLEDLKWNDGNSMKMIYIAGNEEFSQGPIDYTEVCKKAIADGIVINTIFCGDLSSGINGKWNTGAEVGGGDFISISQDETTVYISTPFDDEINDLNSRLNETYIPYGAKGNEKKSNQIRQDKNASSYSISNAAERTKFKSSKKYKADDWDLVDAYKKDKSVLKNADIKSDKYKSMSIEDLESNIAEVVIQRESIQSEIRALDKKREDYKISQKKKSAKGKKTSLQQSIINTVKKQAEKKGFQIKE